MNFFYNIFILLYKITLWCLSLFNNKAKDIVKNQKNLIQKIQSSTNGERNIVWFHAASLGEFEQGKSVIKIYKQKNPNHKILLSFYSPSGYNNMKNSELADWVFYLPHDTRENAKFIAKNIKPLKVIFIKYEFWFNYIREMKKENIPVYFIASIFRKEQYFFKFYGKWFARQLQKVSYFFVQNTESEKLLKSIDINNVKVIGDSRFETVLDNARKEYTNRIIQEFCKNSKILIAGSTWKNDLNLFEIFDELHLLFDLLDYKIIIAPHELDHLGKIQGIGKKAKLNSVLLSNCKISDCNNFDILIIDEIGILSKIYRYADIAYIGGGFGKGIHNCLEAAVYNIPIVFGPNYHKFQEAKDFISLGIAKSVNNSDEFRNSISNFEKLDIKQISVDYFKNKIGVAEIITQHI
jgi:3-deoxy-D-manno-octulosonic-acid transferase